MLNRFPSLAFGLLFPHLVLASKRRERKTRLCLCLLFAPSSCEEVPTDAAGHAGPWRWSFYERVGWNSLLWSWGFGLHHWSVWLKTRLFSWSTQTGTSTLARQDWKAHPQHAILIGPSSSSPKAKQAQKVQRHTKINAGKQTKQAVTGHDEIGRDQQWKNSPRNSSTSGIITWHYYFSPPLRVHPSALRRSYRWWEALTLFPKAQHSLLVLYLQHAWV